MRCYLDVRAVAVSRLNQSVNMIREIGPVLREKYNGYNITIATEGLASSLLKEKMMIKLLWYCDQ